MQNHLNVTFGHPKSGVKKWDVLIRSERGAGTQGKRSPWTKICDAWRGRGDVILGMVISHIIHAPIGNTLFFRPSAKKELEWEIGSTGHNDCVTSARQQMRRLKKEIDPDDFRTQEQIRPSLNRNDRLLAIHEMLQDFENNDFHPNLDDRYAERMYKQASVARMKQDKWNAEEHDSDYDDPTLTERKRPNGRRRR